MQSHKHSDRHKRRHKEHSEGTASFVSMLPAFWCRCCGSGYLKDRRKYSRQRGDARTKTGGEEALLWDPTVWLVRCRAEGQRKRVKR